MGTNLILQILILILLPTELAVIVKTAGSFEMHLQYIMNVNFTYITLRADM